jgi:general secretion pathway protein I
MSSPPKIQSGFTLIEMLIALVIISISFSAIILSVNENARTLLKLQERVGANWVAEEVVSRAQLGLLKANAGSQRMLNQNWRWQLQTKSTPNEYVQELQVTVYNPSEQKVLTLIGFNGAPHAK